MMSADLHYKNALASIAQVQTHSEYLLQLVNWLRGNGELQMAQQIIEDFTAAFARLTAAYDTEKHIADGAAASQDQVTAARSQLVDAQNQLAAAQEALVNEQNKNAELEKALNDAIAAVNSRAPAP
jgi:hypothetical protein